MQRFIAICVAAIFAALTHPASAAHTRATLLLSASAAKPGDTITAAVRLQMDPGWHTYWRNSGESGKPTSIEWQLPSGVTAGEIQWPAPRKNSEDELTTYILEREVFLIVPIKLAKDLKSGSIELQANVSWLECEKQCVPGAQDVSATLEIGSEAKPSADAAQIESVKASLPGDAGNLNPTASWEKVATGNSRPLIIQWNAEWKQGYKSEFIDFFPNSAERYELSNTNANVSPSPDKAVLRFAVTKSEGDWPTQIGGLIVMHSPEKHETFEAIIQVSNPDSKASGNESSAPKNGQSLGLMLLYAFIGGLILNIMPCVLPVIALKILGFVSQAKESPAHVRKLGLLYAAGVLVSFLALAALAIGIKAAGHRAGWGIQFSNPYFIVGLTVLVTLIALNLFGVFEVTLGGRAMSAAGEVASRGGTSGAFLNGVLATVLATPCTAPFLGASLGFAFAQPAHIVVAIFLTVGAGLAAPYVLLSWQPAWLKFLPKPGVWMERFKVGMGFPMLLTAVWLLSLAEPFYGARTMWLAVFLVFVAVAAWVFGFSSRVRGALAAIIILCAGYFLVLEGQLHWREPVKASTTTHKFIATPPKGYDWEPWSNDAVAKARASGHPVLVDFTANWCPTCNAVVKPVLQSESVRAKAKAVNAVALLADHSLYPPEISDELKRYDRAGVPLVLVFPRDPNLPAIVLPETPTPGMVIEALEKAAK